MYFAKLKIDRTKPRVRRSLADRQNMHSIIQSMFDSDRKSYNVLYRINGDSLYISSEIAPNRHKDFELLGVKKWEVADGMHRFSIVTIPRKGVNGKKYILRTEEERLEWLSKQAQKNGFEIASVIEIGQEPINSRRKHFDVMAYRYDGVLRITDKELFQQALLEGIGPMKAYGCGLLVVA